MIASFFDASNVSLEDAGTGDVSPVLIVEDIPIVSNWCPGRPVHKVSLLVDFVVKPCQTA